MKYLKKFNESYVNPILDYLTDFIDLYDFDIDVPRMGVCVLRLNSNQYDAQKVLSLYQELISRLEEEYELKGGEDTYIHFYKEMVHIRIERIVKDSSQEFKFETKEQEIAYNAILKAISPIKLELSEIHSNDFMRFSKMNTEYSYIIDWVSIDRNGRVHLPILRGRKSKKRTELSFNDLDVNWFKRLLELDEDGFRTEEYNWMGTADQEELRKKYQ